MLGNIFIGVQPTFGYEDDPMRLLMSKGGAPHHGFAAFYAYLEKVFKADAVVHVGTHGAMEFMPGKQVGLSEECWPDRLIGELPNIYIYSVNNPSEGTIAKRRSYAELISFVTDRPGHDRRYAMNISKIRRELGWQPKESFETGLEKTVHWYLANLERHFARAVA